MIEKLAFDTKIEPRGLKVQKTDSIQDESSIMSNSATNSVLKQGLNSIFDLGLDTLYSLLGKTGYIENQDEHKERNLYDMAKILSGVRQDVNYDINLSENQQIDLETVKNTYLENKQVYNDIAKAVSDRTGYKIPPELVCAIHYRESDNDFTTYLHNGDPLGEYVEHEPYGTKYFEDFSEAAVDALEQKLNDGCFKTVANSLETKDDFSTMSSVLAYAEAYNGTGYREYHNCPSPYVYAGTDFYNNNPNAGMYVEDNQFSQDTLDDRLGVYVITKELLKMRY